MASSGRLLVALCVVVALFAARSEAHGLGDFTSGNTAAATPEMQSFFSAANKPMAAALPEALGASMPAKPEAASATIPTTTAATTTTTTTGASTTSNNDSAPPRRSVSLAAGVACGVAAVAVVGVAAAVAYVVRARRGGGARRESAVQLGATP